MEVVARQGRRDGPRVGRAPLVAGRIGVIHVTHHVVGNGRGILDAVVLALEPAVEPSDEVGVGRQLLRVRRELELANAGRGADAVGPWPHHQLLAAAGTFGPERLVADEPIDGTLREEVVPAADVAGRHADPRVLVRPEAEDAPPVVEGRMADHGLENGFRKAVLLEPIADEGLAEDTAGVGRVVVEVGRSDGDVLCGEPWGLRRGRGVLRDAQCGSSPRPDLAVAPGLA